MNKIDHLFLRKPIANYKVANKLKIHHSDKASGKISGRQQGFLPWDQTRRKSTEQVSKQ